MSNISYTCSQYFYSVNGDNLLELGSLDHSILTYIVTSFLGYMVPQYILYISILTSYIVTRFLGHMVLPNISHVILDYINIIPVHNTSMV